MAVKIIIITQGVQIISIIVT